MRDDSTPIHTPGKTVQVHDLESNFLSTVSAPNTTPSPAQLRASFTEALSQMQGVFKSMKEEMNAFTASLNSTSLDIIEFRKEIIDMKSQLKELDRYKTEVKTLRAEVAELRQGLSTKEQRSLRKDVEITGLTEHKGENLQHILNVLSTKLSVELDPRDVDDVRRVGLFGGGEGGEARPRPVVLTFTRRAPRDHMIHAARVRRGLTSDSLDIAGTSRRVFINERLTKENRILFSKARSLGAKLGFKYVWTKNGRILMRRSDTSSVVRVESESILDNLAGNSKPTQVECQSEPSAKPEPKNCS